MKRNGRSGNGKQRRLCLACGRSFVKETHTVFASRKLGEEKFRRLIALIIRDATVGTISECLGVSSKTAYVWRMRLYSCFAGYQKSLVLKGKVWIDETMFPVSGGKICFGEGGRKLRGASRNQTVVCAGIDSGWHRIAFVAGRGHISSARCLEVYGPHVERGSELVHDGTFSHDRLVKEKGLKGTTCKSTVKSFRPHMKPIDDFCAMIKRNKVIHIGGREDYLQNYLDWITFKPCPRGLRMDGKIRKVEAYCFHSGVVFCVKDRY